MTVLFYPDGNAVDSPSIFLGPDQKLTVVAFGAPASDIRFEAVFVAPVPPDPCACPPIPAVIPGVAGTAPIQCSGEQVTINSENQIAVFDRPQGFWVRATTETPPGVWVIASISASQGCCCDD